MRAGVTRGRALAKVWERTPHQLSCPKNLIGLYLSQKICQQILSHCPRMKYMVTDFEKAFWTAMMMTANQNNRTINHQGCAFHWAQAVYRKFQNYGLASKYKSDRNFKKFARKIFSLPFLPNNHIAPAFQQLFPMNTNNPSLKRLKKYFFFLMKTF